MDISSKMIGKARRSALKASTKTPCTACIAYGNRCSDSRPCKKCVRTGRQCIGARDSSSELNPILGEAFSIDRPLEFKSVMTLNRHNTSKLSGCNKIEWSHTQTSNFERCGYRVGFLENFFSSFSISDCSELVKAISEVTSSYASIGRLADAPPLQVDDPTALLNISESECLRDMDVETALIFTRHDPDSGCRTVLANSSHAAMFGLHREEFLARASGCDLALPFSERDSLVILLHQAVADALRIPPVGEMYMRVFVGASRTCALAAISSVARKDVVGRIREVAPPPLSPSLSPSFFSPPASLLFPLPSLLFPFLHLRCY
jgi:hypothetical protein